ncbi:GNAT family N-acetyltransferase [Salinisphaera sp. T31B1]|uniref:GNAT family N-acetyltransferase n=1 Tax=Salinisphaera sp. T31B1 TaxID=727963 RepID=UPI0033415E59
MSRLRLHPADTPADRGVLAALAHRIWYQHYPGIISLAQIEYMLERGYSDTALADQQRSGTRLMLAWLDNRACGFAATTPAGEAAWLDKLYVLETTRGTGMGRALVADAIDHARHHGCQTLRLRVNRNNHDALAAYHRLGFVIETADVKAIGNGFVMDDYVMRRHLPGP